MLFTVAKTWKQPKCLSADECEKRRWGGVCVCVCVCIIEYYSIIKTEIMSFAATWMDLYIIILSEVSQTEKENTI